MHGNIRTTSAEFPIHSKCAGVDPGVKSHRAAVPQLAKVLDHVVVLPHAFRLARTVLRRIQRIASERVSDRVALTHRHVRLQGVFLVHDRHGRDIRAADELESVGVRLGRGSPDADFKRLRASRHEVPLCDVAVAGDRVPSVDHGPVVGEDVRSFLSGIAYFTLAHFCKRKKRTEIIGK